MPYPDSPFSATFSSQLIINLGDGKSLPTISSEEYRKTLKWLCSFPKITSYRVNRLKSNIEYVRKLIQERCNNVSGVDSVMVKKHSLIPSVIIILSNNNGKCMEKYDNEIIVDIDCACAVSRGAHVYAPGVLGMLAGCQINDKVSIYADVGKKCKKGMQKLYSDGQKVFIGNGIVKMQRYELFGKNIKPSGVAVEVTETISGCAPLGDNFLPTGWALLQNLPSILCVLALNPQPKETVIDMCASPGNKTTHIAELMQNEGIIIAIDKTARKVAQLKNKCFEFGAEVSTFEADSTKIVALDSEMGKSVTDGPPFPLKSFDRILLDAPCSVLGKRPQFANRLSENEIKSYVPLQRKLFESAVKLLKVNGSLVYSTCTITLSENEGIVAWALNTFKDLELIKPNFSLGGEGWPGTTLTEEERGRVQRFGPDQDIDSVGFFFACFVKKSSLIK